MAIDWQKLPEPGAGAPYDGQQVLVAVPNRVGDAWGGDGLKLDEDFPYTPYLARWNAGEGQWETTETDDPPGGMLRLSLEQPTRWAVLNLPGE